MGAFDDLIQAAKPSAGGAFANLIPEAKTDQDVENMRLATRNSITQGLGDPLQGGAQLLMHTLGPSVVNGINSGVQTLNDIPYLGAGLKAIGFTPMTIEQQDKNIQDREAAYQAERTRLGDSGFDTGRVVGTTAATLPLTAASGVGSLLGTGVKAALGNGAAAGVSGALLNPETDPDFWTTKGKDVALSAAGGAAIGGAVHGLAGAIAPKVSDAVRSLLDRGVTPTMGQLRGGLLGTLEEKATSIPLLGDMIKNAQRRGVEDLNRAAYNDVLAPLGQKFDGKIGREGIAQVEQKISNAYQDVLPKLTFKADDQFGSEIANLMDMAKNLPEQQAKQFEKIIKDQVVGKISQTGMMDGQTLKGVESVLSKEASGYGSSAHFDDRKLGDALGEALASFRNTLTRSNPDQAEALSAANAAWAKYTRLRQAGQMLGAKEGVISPSQLQSAVRAGDASVGNGQFAKGNALMQDLSDPALSVLGSHYPDSGSAGRMFLGLLGAAGAGAINLPAAAGVSALTLPYTRLGQKVMSGLLAGNRSNVTSPLAAGLLKAAPALETGLLAAGRGPFGGT